MNGYMNHILRVTSLLTLSSAICLAETWSGALVDSECFATAKHNVSHDAGHTGTDQRRMIRHCAPNANTKSFTIVEQDGTAFDLNAGGNDKAAELVQKTSAKRPYLVTITGAKNESTLQVNEIALKK